VARFDPTSTADGQELLPRDGDASAAIHVPTSAIYYEDAIEGLTRINQRMLREAEFPRIYESGVGYRKESEDTWRHADDVLCSGWGDCEDLAAWRAAELRESGEDPLARVYVYRSGPLRFHAVVARGNGQIEDPSLILGMVVSNERRAQLPKWEGDTEMDDVKPREFAVCRGSCGNCPNHSSAGEDILSRGAVGDPGALLTEPNVGSFFSSLGHNIRHAAGQAAGRAARFARPSVPNYRPMGAARVMPSFNNRPANLVGTTDEDGSGQDMMGGIDDDDLGHGPGDSSDDAEYADAYGDGGSYDGGSYDGQDSADYGENPEDAPAEQQQDAGPDAMTRALNAAGGGIKSAASSAWDVTKAVFNPIKYGVQTAVAPIHMVSKLAEKSKKYLTAPVKAVNKILSLLGSDEVLPEQVGYVEDEEYQAGDEDIFEEMGYLDENGNGVEYDEVPSSQKPQFQTFQDPTTGAWHGQVKLPAKEPGMAVRLTSTPALDESSAAERMYNLAKHASNTPALMALTNPLAFTTLMLLKGTSKVPFGGAFKAVGSGIASAARAVGRGAESLAQTATEW
jgi:hypothetical protein